MKIAVLSLSVAAVFVFLSVAFRWPMFFCAYTDRVDGALHGQCGYGPMSSLSEAVVSEFPWCGPASGPVFAMRLSALTIRSGSVAHVATQDVVFDLHAPTEQVCRSTFIEAERDLLLRNTAIPQMGHQDGELKFHLYDLRQ